MEFRDSLDSTLQQLHQLTVYDGVLEVKVHWSSLPCSYSHITHMLLKDFVTIIFSA